MRNESIGEHVETPKARTTKRFSWDLVDRTVLRAMLIALYERGDLAPEVARVRGLSDAALAQQARRSFW